MGFASRPSSKTRAQVPAIPFMRLQIYTLASRSYGEGCQLLRVSGAYDGCKAAPALHNITSSLAILTPYLQPLLSTTRHHLRQVLHAICSLFMPGKAAVADMASSYGAFQRR